MRKIINLNDNWLFVHGDADPAVLPREGEKVSLPHTWNAVDGHDGHDIEVPSLDWSQGDLSGAPAEHYDRGSYWYFRTFDTPRQPLPGGKTFIEIPAAGLQAEVFVNGRKAAEHEGGFSAFRADITELCAEGENLLAVHVSNEYRSNVYPQHADFTFYGGLYRGVTLISTAAVHFDLEYFGGPGISVHASPLDQAAAFDLKAWVRGADENDTVYWSVLDPEGREAAGAMRPADSPDVELCIPGAKLWSPDSPNL